MLERRNASLLIAKIADKLPSLKVFVDYYFRATPESPKDKTIIKGRFTNIVYLNTHMQKTLNFVKKIMHALFFTKNRDI